MLISAQAYDLKAPNGAYNPQPVAGSVDCLQAIDWDHGTVFYSEHKDETQLGPDQIKTPPSNQEEILHPEFEQ